MGVIKGERTGIKLHLIDMEERDKKDWEKFRANTSDRIVREEVELISQLHSKYFKHKYKVPCSCSPKTIQGWIEDLNDVYNGIKDPL